MAKSMLAVAVLALSTISCDITRQRVLVWHDWPAPEAEVLAELLNGYSELDPDLQLIIEFVPTDELEARFAEQARSGLGPDVLIGVDADRLAELVAADTVHSLSGAVVEQMGFDELDSRAMEAMAIDGRQHGIPMTGSTDVLYHREGVTPPENLDAIIELAEAGYSTGVAVDFVGGYWGVDAFAGTTFGGDGTLDPDRGFVEWMRWLVDARPQPNIILDGDYETLRDLFAAGRLDVFIGGSRELGTFRAVLNEGGTDEGGDGGATPLPDIEDVTFGLATLPAGANPTPGGFLEIEGLVVNRHTDNLEESLALLEYLTNVPSQGRIARSGLGRIPVNEAVSIDPTISPMEASLVQQQRRSVVLPRAFEENLAELRELGDEVYLQVARGLLEPSAAAVELRDRYAAISGAE